jgi:hypothetical protein
MHQHLPKQPLFNPVARRLTRTQRQWLKEKQVPLKDQPTLARLMLEDSPSRLRH